MAGKNDKWVMFRNYMHNELGITKDDIKEWIQEAIHEEVKNVVSNAYGKCNIEGEIQNAIRGNRYWGSESLNNSVIEKAGKYIASRLEISVKE